MLPQFQLAVAFDFNKVLALWAHPSEVALKFESCIIGFRLSAMPICHDGHGAGDFCR